MDDERANERIHYHKVQGGGGGGRRATAVAATGGRSEAAREEGTSILDEFSMCCVNSILDEL